MVKKLIFFFSGGKCIRLVDSKKNGKNENGSRLREVLSNFDKNKITKREREKEEGQFVFRKVRGVYKFGRRKSGITKKGRKSFRRRFLSLCVKHSYF